MNPYLQVAILSVIGGLFSLCGGLFLLSRKTIAENLAHYATPFAAGALLAAVFLDLLKDGIEEASADTVLLATLSGMLVFFIAERFISWLHHHHGHQEDRSNITKPLIITGDTLHNAMDGIAIAAGFLVSPATGFVTTVAVAAHEIPQEIGDFGLLLAKGMRRRQVVLVNIMSSLATTLMALLTYSLGSSNRLPIGALLGLSAGFLLYIAASDLIPEIHDSTPRHKLFDWRPALLLAGVMVVGISIELAHHFIG